MGRWEKEGTTKNWTRRVISNRVPGYNRYDRDDLSLFHEPREGSSSSLSLLRLPMNYNRTAANPGSRETLSFRFVSNIGKIKLDVDGGEGLMRRLPRRIF